MDSSSEPNNPLAANFLYNQPVIFTSKEVVGFDQRAARANIRFMHQCGHSVSYLAHISAVPEAVVTAAVENASNDRIDDDQHYIGDDVKQAFADTDLNIEQKNNVDIGQVMPTQLQAQVKSLSTYRVGPPRQQTVHAAAVSAPENCINPSVEDFLRCIPGIPARRPGRKFNRVGRALARGVYGYADYETFTQISVAFGSTHNPVRQAVLNLHSPRDNVDDDPGHLPDGFLDAYPWRPKFRPTMSTRAAKRLAKSLEGEGKVIQSATKHQKIRHSGASDMEEEVDFASDTEVHQFTPDVEADLGAPNTKGDGFSSDAEVDQLASDTEWDHHSVPNIASIPEVVLTQPRQNTSPIPAQQATAKVKRSGATQTRYTATRLSHHRYPTRSSKPLSVVGRGDVSPTRSVACSPAASSGNSFSVVGVHASRPTTCSGAITAIPRHPTVPVASAARFATCSRAVAELLVNVDRFDLSAWANLFGKKGLGTMDALVNAGHLGATRLENLFKRILEDDPMPQAQLLLLIDKILGLAKTK